MMKVRTTVGGVAFALLLASVVAGPVALEAQGPDGRWPLQPRPPGGEAKVIPFMEGWYPNEDGSYTISFGYLNRDRELIQIPRGEDNFIESAQFDGMQPTTFRPGRQRGVFTVTLSADMKDEDVWWNLRNPNGEITRVPGRTRASAYELDWNARPQGSRHPLLRFEGEEGRGPAGVTAERTETVSVGSPLELTVSARDPSERDRDDFRFKDPIALNVSWSTHQGPGDVEFTRHESTPGPEDDDDDDDDDAAAARAAAIAAAATAAGRGGGRGAAAAAGRGGRGAVTVTAAAAGRGRGRRPAPNTIPLPEGEGTAQVYATFSEPGEYILRVQVDNFRASDSGSGDQCCWTNGYVRVTVRQ